MGPIKVFLSHSNDLDDQRLVNDEIIPKLRSKEIEIRTQDEALPGQMFLSRLTEIFEEVDKTLLFMTKNSLERPWCNLELLMGLEDSQNKEQLSVVLLLNDVQDDEIPHITVLQEAIKVNFDQGKDTWVSECVEQLRETKHIKRVMPAGNVAHGLVWSHYVGYVKQVLPVLEEKLKESEWYKNMQENSNISTKLYEMVPKSCTCIFDLHGEENIKLVTPITIKAEVKSGNFRHYNVNVYSIEDGSQTYYFMCDYPAVIGTMKTMEEHHLAKFTEGDKQLQLSRFYYTLNSVINHFDECREKARVLLFNDEAISVSSVLLKAIKADLHKADHILVESQLDMFEGTMRSNYQYLVNVAHSDHDDDKKRAAEIINYLERRGIDSSRILKHLDYELPGQKKNDLVSDAIKKCQWCIFLISKHSLKNEMLKWSVLATLHEGINARKVRVIPVIDRQHGKNLCIPEALQWVTYVRINDRDKSHLKILYNIVSGEDLPLKTELFLPAGNVTIGLAWGYVVNYIQIVLPGILDGVTQAMREKNISKYKCPKMLYVIIPASCEADGLVTDKEKKIKNVTQTPDYYPKGRGTRPFHCQIYNIVDTNLYFVGQYAAPVTCLHEMKSSRVAGVTDDAMESGAENFYETVKTLTVNVAYEESTFCKFVYFKDDEESLADIMKQKIETT